MALQVDRVAGEPAKLAESEVAGLPHQLLERSASLGDIIDRHARTSDCCSAVAGAHQTLHEVA